MSINYPNVTDLSKQDVAQEIACDVLIIGSGAGGGVAAEILTSAGLSVILVEEGPLKTAQDFSMLEKDAYAELYQEVAGRQTRDQSIQILQGRCVGGSTTVNWTSSFRTPPQTLQYWCEQFGIQGLTHQTLQSWFEWAETRLNIKPWPVPPNRNNALLSAGAQSLGWHHQIIARNVKGCANLGYCGMGCPLNAKQSMLVTCIPEALQAGAKLLCRARVENLLMQQGRVMGASISAMDEYGQIRQKHAMQVKARHTILAAGAIGSPAVLLRSGLQRVNPLIGKRTFLHPVTASAALMPEPVSAHSGAPQSVYCDHFLWRDGVQGEVGYKIEVPPLHPLLTASLLRFHGEAHFDLMRQFDNLQVNLALLRDGFHSESRGGIVEMDEYGYPHLDYPMEPVLWRGLRDAMLSLAELQFAAGAKVVMPLHMDGTLLKNWQEAKQKIVDLPTQKLRWQVMSAHVMGGCGMAQDASRGVCSSDGDIFGLEQISVMDGSLFPTSLGVNPQLSIYAIVAKLASILAVKLKGRLPEQFATHLV